MAEGILDLTSKGLSFMLSFSTDEAQQSLAALTPTIDDLIRAAKQAQSASKEAADSTTLWAREISTSWSQVNQQVSQGSEVYQTVDNRLSRLGSSASELGDRIANFLARARQDTKSTENEIFKLVSGLKDLGNEGEKAGGKLNWIKDLFTGITKVGGGLRDFIASLKNAGESRGGGGPTGPGGGSGGGDGNGAEAASAAVAVLSKKMMSLGTIGALTAEILGFKELVIDSGTELEKFSSTIEIFITRLGGSRDDFIKWRTTILDLAVELKRSTPEIIQAMQAFLTAAKDPRLVEAPDLAKPYLASIVKLSEVLGIGKTEIASMIGELHKLNIVTSENAAEMANVLAGTMKKGFNPAEVAQLIGGNIEQIKNWSVRLRETLKQTTDYTEEQIGEAVNKNAAAIAGNMLEAQQVLMKAGGDPSDINRVFSNIFSPMTEEFLKAATTFANAGQETGDRLKELMHDFLTTGNFKPLLSQLYELAQSIPTENIAVMKEQLDNQGNALSGSFSSFLTALKNTSRQSIDEIGGLTASSIGNTKALDQAYKDLNATLANIIKETRNLMGIFGEQVAVKMGPVVEDFANAARKIAEFLAKSDAAKEAVVALGSAMIALPIASLIGTLGSALGGGLVGALTSGESALMLFGSGISKLTLAITGLMAVGLHNWLLKNNESYKELNERLSESGTVTSSFKDVIDSLSDTYKKLGVIVNDVKEAIQVRIEGTWIQSLINDLRRDLKDLDFLKIFDTLLDHINNTLAAISQLDFSKARSNITAMLDIVHNPFGSSNTTAEPPPPSISAPALSGGQGSNQSATPTNANPFGTADPQDPGSYSRSGMILEYLNDRFNRLFSGGEESGQASPAFIDTDVSNLNNATSVPILNALNDIRDTLRSRNDIGIDPKLLTEQFNSIKEELLTRDNIVDPKLLTEQFNSIKDQFNTSMSRSVNLTDSSIENLSKAIADLVPNHTPINYESTNEIAALKEEIRKLVAVVPAIVNKAQEANVDSTRSVNATTSNSDSSKETDRIVAAINESAASIVGSVKDLASSRFMIHRSRSDSNYH